MRLSVLCAGVIISMFAYGPIQIRETEATIFFHRYYPYAIKGFVSDVRLHPLRFVGSLFFKKAFLLKKLKIKLKIKKKIILKLLLKKLVYGRKKREVRFPEDESHSQSSSQGSSAHPPSPVLPVSDHASHPSGHFSDGDGYDHYSQLYSRELDELEPSDSEIQDYFSMAREFDSHGCIPKGICEVMAHRNHSTNAWENSIFDYYNDQTARLEKADSAGYLYDYAAFLGKSTGDATECSRYYPECSDEPQTLNSFMNEVFVSEMCDAASQYN